MPQVHFNFLKGISLRDRTKLQQFILSIFRKEGVKPGNINYIFCDDTYILEINQQYLQHNYYTDIITFDLSAPGSTTKDADIFISVDTVRDNAASFKSTLKQEIHRVIFHGVLHLCGYKDKTTTDAKLMRSKEEEYLGRYFG